MSPKDKAQEAVRAACARVVFDHWYINAAKNDRNAKMLLQADRMFAKTVDELTEVLAANAPYLAAEREATC